MKHLLRTIIVDDEQNSREVLIQLLSEYPQIKIVDEAKNAEEAFQKISDENPDLVFLDIQMPKGDGFSLVKKFSQINFEIIFVTSFDQYAINAIKVSALDYLLKPIITDELELAIEKASKHISNKRSIRDKVNALIRLLQMPLATQKISVHVNGQVKLLAFNDILMVEALGRYATITLFDGRTYITAKNLKDIEEELTFSRIFLRVNKSQLININGITSYSKTRSCFITLINDHTIEVSRRKKSEIVTLLNTTPLQIAK